MIRKLAGFIMILGALGVLAAGVPLVAQAAVFIQKQKDSAENVETPDSPAPKKKRGNVFVAPKKDEQGKAAKTFDPYSYREQEKSMASRLKPGDVGAFNLDLLTSAGGEPTTVRDLLMVATAHNAVKNEALEALRSDVQTQVNAVAARDPKQPKEQASAEAGDQDSGKTVKGKTNDSGTASAVEATPAKKKTKLFVTPGKKDEKTKPTGVFKNY